MSVVEVYDPKFDVFHGDPVVIWKDKHGRTRIATNMLKQYDAWLSSGREHRFERAISDGFWQSNGPAICRALRYVGAAALVFEWESDRKVCYRWFARKPEMKYNGLTHDTNWYCLCSVTSEGGQLGCDTRVTVTLPTDEDVHFAFLSTEMKKWLKQEPKVEVQP